MPSQPHPDKAARRFEREQANARVARAYKEGRNWHKVATSNVVHYITARGAVLAADEEIKEHGGLPHGECQAGRASNEQTGRMYRRRLLPHVRRSARSAV